ncbi:MAG: ACP S-malonyltransferase [Candidatus Krumholzibacteria bacterium]|nr:ACP S-malonyltransferase [Candidatus Krumholzibacteria bacterium]
MNVGMLFPGQGAQHVGMGRDYYDRFSEARELYRSANVRLGFDIAEMSFSGDLGELTQTRNAQPALLLHSMVVLAALEARGVRASIVAGHSLGEFSALVAAGFFTAMDALAVVRRRGELMYEIGVERPGAMAAVIGLDENAVETCVREVTDGVVVVANYNSHAQSAISGEVEAVERAGERCREAGAKRVLRLPVSGAFHSPLMEPAVTELRRYLQKVAHGKLRVPWVANVTGDVVEDPARVVDLLARQLSSPVRWIASMETFTRRWTGPIYEVGPGQVLSGLMKRIVEGVEVVPVGEVEALERLG